jgi:hypothetical protein
MIFLFIITVMVVSNFGYKASDNDMATKLSSVFSKLTHTAGLVEAEDTNETIQAKATPFAFRFDPNETSRFFYYAIGWTWVKDQAQ